MDCNMEAGADREISVIVAEADPDNITLGAANRTLARGFRATADVIVPAH